MSSLSIALANIRADPSSSLGTSTNNDSSRKKSGRNSFSSGMSANAGRGRGRCGLPPLCTFHLQGRCTRGSSCSFRHETSVNSSEVGGNVGIETRESYVGAEQPRSICKYFAKGFCSRGSSCRYSHDTTLNSSQTASQSLSYGSEPQQNFPRLSEQSIPSGFPSATKEKPSIESIRARAARAKEATGRTTSLSEVESNSSFVNGSFGQVNLNNSIPRGEPVSYSVGSSQSLASITTSSLAVAAKGGWNHLDTSRSRVITGGMQQSLLNDTSNASNISQVGLESIQYTLGTTFTALDGSSYATKPIVLTMQDMPAGENKDSSRIHTARISANGNYEANVVAAQHVGQCSFRPQNDSLAEEEEPRKRDSAKVGIADARNQSNAENATPKESMFHDSKKSVEDCDVDIAPPGAKLKTGYETATSHSENELRLEKLSETVDGGQLSSPVVVTSNVTHVHESSSTNASSLQKAVAASAMNSFPLPFVSANQCSSVDHDWANKNENIASKSSLQSSLVVSLRECCAEKTASPHSLGEEEDGMKLPPISNPKPLLQLMPASSLDTQTPRNNAKLSSAEATSGAGESTLSNLSRRRTPSLQCMEGTMQTPPATIEESELQSLEQSSLPFAVPYQNKLDSTSYPPAITIATEFSSGIKQNATSASSHDLIMPNLEKSNATTFSESKLSAKHFLATASSIFHEENGQQGLSPSLSNATSRHWMMDASTLSKNNIKSKSESDSLTPFSGNLPCQQLQLQSPKHSSLAFDATNQFMSKLTSSSLIEDESKTTDTQLPTKPTSRLQASVATISSSHRGMERVKDTKPVAADSIASRASKHYTDCVDIYSTSKSSHQLSLGRDQDLAQKITHTESSLVCATTQQHDVNNKSSDSKPVYSNTKDSTASFTSILNAENPKSSMQSPLVASLLTSQLDKKIPNKNISSTENNCSEALKKSPVLAITNAKLNSSLQSHMSKHQDFQQTPPKQSSLACATAKPGSSKPSLSSLAAAVSARDKDPAAISVLTQLPTKPRSSLQSSLNAATSKQQRADVTENSLSVLSDEAQEVGNGSIVKAKEQPTAASFVANSTLNTSLQSSQQSSPKQLLQGMSKPMVSSLAAAAQSESEEPGAISGANQLLTKPRSSLQSSLAVTSSQQRKGQIAEKTLSSLSNVTAVVDESNVKASEQSSYPSTVSSTSLESSHSKHQDIQQTPPKQSSLACAMAKPGSSKPSLSSLAAAASARDKDPAAISVLTQLPTKPRSSLQSSLNAATSKQQRADVTENTLSMVSNEAQEVGNGSIVKAKEQPTAAPSTLNTSLQSSLSRHQDFQQSSPKQLLQGMSKPMVSSLAAAAQSKQKKTGAISGANQLLTKPRSSLQSSLDDSFSSKLRMEVSNNPLSSSACRRFEQEALNKSIRQDITKLAVNSSQQLFQTTPLESDSSFLSFSNPPSKNVDSEHSITAKNLRLSPTLPQESMPVESLSGRMGSMASQTPSEAFSTSLLSSLAKASTRTDNARSSATVLTLAQGTKNQNLLSSSVSKKVSRSWSKIVSSKPVAKQHGLKMPLPSVHQNNEDVKATLKPQKHREPIGKNTDETSHVIHQNVLELPSVVAKHGVSISELSSFNAAESGSMNQQHSMKNKSSSHESSLMPVTQATLLSVRDKTSGLSSGDAVGANRWLTSETCQKNSTPAHQKNRRRREFPERNDSHDRPSFSDDVVVASQKETRSNPIAGSWASGASLALTVAREQVDTKTVSTNEIGRSSGGIHDSEAEAKASILPDRNEIGVKTDDDLKPRPAAPQLVEYPNEKEPDQISFTDNLSNKKKDVIPITAANVPETRSAFSYASIASRQQKKACSWDDSPDQANEHRTETSSLRSSGRSSDSNIQNKSSGFQQPYVPASASTRFRKVKDLKSSFDSEPPFTHSSSHLPVPIRTQNNHQRAWAKQGSSKLANINQSQRHETSNNRWYGNHGNTRQKNTKDKREKNNHHYSANKINLGTTMKSNNQADESVVYVVDSNPTEKGKVWVSGVIIPKKNSTSATNAIQTLKRWADESDSDDE